MTKHCAYPGCNKPLPESFKIPLCDYHRAVIKETGEKAGGTVVAIGTGIAMFVKTGGVDLVKKHGSKVTKVIESIARKK